MITREDNAMMQVQNKKAASRAIAAKKEKAEKEKWNADDDALIKAFNAGVLRRQEMARENSANVAHVPEKGNDIDINVNVEKENVFGNIVMALTMCAVAVDLIIHLVNML